MGAGPDPAEVARCVDAALSEDLGSLGDRTTDALIPAQQSANARIVARGPLVVAGLPVAEAVFRRLDPDVAFEAEAAEGQPVERGDRLARLRGPAGPILRGERTALNFLMRMSGIAGAARAAVDEIAGTGARILDTRKTAPGLRALDKYAVRTGGADNHRRGLYDAVMIKDTHLAVCGGDVAAAVARARECGHAPETITVEVTTPEQLQAAIDAGAGRALLDNRDLAALRRLAALGRGRIVLEASGGLRPGRLRPVAETGVDCLSLGWLTHSAPAADLALEIDVEERGS